MTAAGNLQPAVSVALQRDNTLLLVRRLRPPAQDFFAFPGGRVEPGETVEAAARRELAEETGLSTAELWPLEVLNIDGEAGGQAFRLHVFSGQYIGGEPVAGDDAADAGWYSLADMEGQPVLPSVLAVARKLLR